MNKILSLNHNHDIVNPTDDDYYYPLSDIMLFKNYNSYLNGEMTNNSTNNLGNNTGNNLVNNNSANNSTNNLVNNNSANNSTNNLVNNNSANNSTNNLVNNNSGNNTSNNLVNNNSSNNSLLSPSPSMVDIVEEVVQQNQMINENISDFNQPGIEGLKILVKNGKKPLAYVPNPTAVIPGQNGNNLYVWEPIPPKDYICMGCVCTVSLKPTPPNVGECPIRCVPISCLDELQISLSDDLKIPGINPPYHLFQVSDGKFVKGNMDIPNKIGLNIKSYEINEICDNTEWMKKIIQ